MIGSGRQHDQSVKPERDAGALRHPVIECGEEILVDRIGFAVERQLSRLVRRKAASLLGGIGQLAERVGEFEAAYVQLEALGKARVTRLWAGQRGERQRIVIKD